jgi:hypothetical protein
MKSRAGLKLVFAAALVVGPLMCPNDAIDAAESVSSFSSPSKVHLGLTTDQRNKFLSAAENSLHASARVTPAFWTWLKKHPDVRAGVLTSADPVPAVYAENLDHLRIALGPVISEHYASLLLGVALTDELQPATATGGDGAYNASAFGNSADGATDPRVMRVASYMKQKGITLENFVANEDSILSDLGVGKLTPKERGSFVDDVAFATKTYPPRVELPLVACLKKLIGRFETHAGPFNDKGPQWPLFPIDSAPFPLLAPLRQTLPERELDYLWERFNARIPGVKDRLPTYGHYTFDYDKPEIRYKKSDWYPSALPRIIEDGGVCGRLSTLAQLSAVGLGRPAVGMYQPGHRALLTYHLDPKTGHYLASMDQSITSPDTSTNQWFMPAPTGLRVEKSGKVVSVEWHFALALSMNLGLDRYTDSRICLYLANRLPAGSNDRKIDLLKSATDLNPYNLEAWYAWSALNGTNTAATNQLLQQLDALLFNPDAGMGQEKELAANTDLGKRATSDTPDLHKQSNIVAAMVGDAIVVDSYRAALADKASAPKNLANLKAEIDRRAQMKLPHGPAVLALVDSYTMNAGGASGTQQEVTEAVQQLENATPKDRKKQSDAVEKRVSAVVTAMGSPTDAAQWLTKLYDSFPEASRFTANTEGKVDVDPLYAFLHKELIEQLQASGKDGKLEARKINADFDAAKTAFKPA